MNIEVDITEDMVDLKDFNFFISMDYSVVGDKDAVLDETYFYVSEYDKYFELKYPEKDQFVSESQFKKFFSELKLYTKQLLDMFDNLHQKTDTALDMSNHSAISLESEDIIISQNKDKVLTEVIKQIDNFNPDKNYSYELDDEKNYLSWVQSRKLV